MDTSAPITVTVGRAPGGVSSYALNGSRTVADALTTAGIELRTGDHVLDWFFMAMVHWRTQNKKQAAKAYDRAIEIMRQLRGECPPERQVTGARRGLTDIHGGTASYSVVSILERRD